MRSDGYGRVKLLGILILVVVVVGALFAVVSFFSAGFSEVFRKDLCFSNDCFANAFELYSATIAIGEAVLSLVTAIAMTGGILIALYSYLNNVKTNALSNHLSHVSVFQGFVSQEITRRPFVELKSVDVFKWYNRIFENSRRGSMDLSKDYLGLVRRLNCLIDESNIASKARKQEKGYRYTEHQDNMIEVLSEFGINISRAPRNEFYEVEGQVLSLVSCVNREFCYSDDVPPINERGYL